LKRVLTQARLLGDSGVSGLSRQHPRRNLQSLAAAVEDSNCSVSALRPPDELQGSAVQGVEWIQHLDTRRFCAQGIVSADATIRTFIASFQPADYRLITPAGSNRATRSSFR
jgi:hypothetical protein